MDASRTTTLRERRAGRSSWFSLRGPLYITRPNTLIALLEDAPYDRLPWYYQARTLEESYNGRQTPFFWNRIQLDSQRARCLEPSPPAKKPRLADKKVTLVIKREDVLKFKTRRTAPIRSPEPRRVCPDRLGPKIKLSAAFRKSTGARAAAGSGLLGDATKRIRIFQRGESFVWVIQPAPAVN